MINELPTTIKEEGLTVAEQLILEGKEIAKKEFEQEKQNILKQEKQKQRASIIKMLKHGKLSNEEIADFTNASIEFINQIKKRLDKK